MADYEVDRRIVYANYVVENLLFKLNVTAPQVIARRKNIRALRAERHFARLEYRRNDLKIMKQHKLRTREPKCAMKKRQVERIVISR